MEIFVGGGQSFYGPTVVRDAIVTVELANQLHAALGDKITIVTGGMPGVPDLFARNYPGRLLDVICSEYKTGYLERKTGRPYEVTGKSQEARRLAVTHRPNILCAIFIQGGMYSTHELKLFHERGVLIVPLWGGGGAAGGHQPYEGWSLGLDPSWPQALLDTDPAANPVAIARAMCELCVEFCSRE